MSEQFRAWSRRVASAVMALLMTLSMLPAQGIAYAWDEGITDDIVEFWAETYEQNVARVMENGDAAHANYYEHLDDAFVAW